MLAALALAELRLVVLPVIGALVLGTLLRPPTLWLGGRGVPPGLAAFAVVAATVIALAGIVAALAPPVLAELRSLDVNLQEGLETVVGWIAERPFGVSEADVDRAIEDALDSLRANAGTLAAGAVSGAVALGELVVGLLLALVLLFFLRDGEVLWGWVVNQFAEWRRPRLHEAGTRAWTALGGYLRGITLVALFDAAFIGLGLRVLGIPLAGSR